jgi:hypothetical protein
MIHENLVASWKLLELIFFKLVITLIKKLGGKLLFKKGEMLGSRYLLGCID